MPDDASASGKVVKTAAMGLPTDAPGLVRRYREALADALARLDGFGYRADAEEIAGNYGLIYEEARARVHLTPAVPPAERIFDEHTR